MAKESRKTTSVMSKDPRQQGGSSLTWLYFHNFDNPYQGRFSPDSELFSYLTILSAMTFVSISPVRIPHVQGIA